MPIEDRVRATSAGVRRLMCGIALLVSHIALAQEPDPMTQIARGTFTVKLQPDTEADVQVGVGLGRMTLSKVFEGDLVGTGAGTMLTAQNATAGSAAYVAIERVSGTLGGRKGSFVFQHQGIMTRDARELSIRVVPDSGTEELTGLAGAFTLTIKDGVHAYEFAYTLP